MKTEEIVGLLGILFGLFLFGILIAMDPISLTILISIGGLVFFILYTKNTHAIFGLTVLLFVLLLYLFLPGTLEQVFTGNQTGGNVTVPGIQVPDYYLPTIVLLLIVIGGFLIAYKASG